MVLAMGIGRKAWSSCGGIATISTWEEFAPLEVDETMLPSTLVDGD
jgi:hypothetical protein